ncbi:MAG: SPASM domain-containing protein [Nitrospirae bacterium]|nr:SPASM domain-containing protein [Nitrospirota bacterium]
MIDDKDIKNYLSLIDKSNKTTSSDSSLGRKIDTTAGSDYVIDPSCDIRGKERMQFGKGVVIQKDCWLNIAFQQAGTGPMIIIGEGSNIGRRCILSAANKIEIGKNVLLAPNVFIADTHHAYQQIGIPIMNQGITTNKDQVTIGDETWIGINSVIMGKVKIGKHCVVGANSVVNKDIPDYCVAVGNPARIVKTYDFAAAKWIRGCWEDDLLHHLQARGDLVDFIVPFHKLKVLQVEVSSACNLSCPQCFRHIDGHTTGFFPRALWEKDILPHMPQLSDIHLVGIGEPFLSKEFFSFVQDAKLHKVRVHTTSNLQLVDESLADKIVRSGLDVLSFSCDAARDETYASIRVNGTLDVMKRSLNLIRASKEKHKSITPRLVLNFGAMKSNIRELADVVKLAKAFQVDSIIAFHDIAYVKDLKDESLFHHQALSDECMVQAKQLADRLGISLSVPNLFSRSPENVSHGEYCGYPFFHLYVNHDGRVGPCCMDFPDRYILGNINHSNLEQIWNSFPILKLRKEVRSNPSAVCKYCAAHGKMAINDPRHFFRFKGSGTYIERTLLGKSHGNYEKENHQDASELI